MQCGIRLSSFLTLLALEFRDLFDGLADEGSGDFQCRPLLRSRCFPCRRKKAAHQTAVNGNGAIMDKRSMERMLWKAACSIRGEKDAPKFKDYILPLVFIKRLSDVFEDEIGQRLAEEFGAEETARTVLEADPSLVRFLHPSGGILARRQRTGKVRLARGAGSRRRSANSLQLRSGRLPVQTRAFKASSISSITTKLEMVNARSATTLSPS